MIPVFWVQTEKLFDRLKAILDASSNKDRGYSYIAAVASIGILQRLDRLIEILEKERKP